MYNQTFPNLLLVLLYRDSGGGEAGVQDQGAIDEIVRSEAKDDERRQHVKEINRLIQLGAIDL